MTNDPTKPIFLKNLGIAIRDKRKAAGDTQAEMAQKVETSEQYIDQVERGEVDVGFCTLREIMYYYDFDFGHFVKNFHELHGIKFYNN